MKIAVLSQLVIRREYLSLLILDSVSKTIFLKHFWFRKPHIQLSSSMQDHYRPYSFKTFPAEK